MKDKIAILGAGGFVGTSLTESLVLAGEPRVRAVVRAYRNFASLARFGDRIDRHIANVEDEPELVKALQDARVVVNLTTGPPSSIHRSTRAILSACRTTQVERLIHLSSAVVYGRVDRDNLPDDAPPLRRHWMPYARAKAKSEEWLRPHINGAQPAVVVLRPGIVWGPRSPHTLNIATTLLQKKAYLVNDGQGIFNSIYIDNLIGCISACLTSTSLLPGYYNVADQETVRWLDLYQKLGMHLDIDTSQISRVSKLPLSRGAVLEYVQELPLVNLMYHLLKQRVPDGMKSAIKAKLSGGYEYRRMVDQAPADIPIDREMWHLQQVQHRLPSTRFVQQFGYRPTVTFAQGVQRTVDWLRAMKYLETKGTDEGKQCRL